MKVIAAAELNKGMSSHMCADRCHSAVTAATLAQAQETQKDQRKALPVIMRRCVHYYYYYYLIELQMGFYSVAMVLQ
jgi:hypothetical protein